MAAPKPRLLIVDDERDILSPYARFMRAKGFEAFEAATAAQALALARAERPDLVLVDVFIDGRDAGFQLCRDLTALPSPPSVFLMTSVMTKLEHRLQAYAAGAAHFLIKPHDLSILERDIRFFLSDTRPASTVGAKAPERSDGPRVLIVDDDEEGARAVSHVLKADGFAPFTAATGAQGLMLAHKLRPQALILDYLLPDTDGRELLRWLRSHPRTQNVPIVMLTSMTSSSRNGLEFDCLKEGADDFVLKGSNDLSALPVRITRLLTARAASPASNANLFRIDEASRKIWIGGRDVDDLAPREFDLLAYLIRRSPAVVPWVDLQRDLWHVPEHALTPGHETPTIAIHVAALRAKLGASAQCMVLHRGRGLQFDPAKAPR